MADDDDEDDDGFLLEILDAAGLGRVTDLARDSRAISGVVLFAFLILTAPGVLVGYALAGTTGAIVGAFVLPAVCVVWAVVAVRRDRREGGLPLNMPPQTPSQKRPRFTLTLGARAPGKPLRPPPAMPSRAYVNHSSLSSRRRYARVYRAYCPAEKLLRYYFSG